MPGLQEHGKVYRISILALAVGFTAWSWGSFQFLSMPMAESASPGARNA